MREGAHRLRSHMCMIMRRLITMSLFYEKGARFGLWAFAEKHMSLLGDGVRSSGEVHASACSGCSLQARMVFGTLTSARVSGFQNDAKSRHTCWVRMTVLHTAFLRAAKCLDAVVHSRIVRMLRAFFKRVNAISGHGGGALSVWFRGLA